jgi:hypothetical protein
MRKLVLSCLLYLLVSAWAAAQPLKYNYSIDTLSFKLYQSGDWKALVQIAEKNKEINFYYYDLRIAFAFYNRGDFRQALQWFNRAESLAKESPEVAGMHYQSALYSGALFEAQRISKLYPQFNFEKSKLLRYISADAGISKNTSYNELINQDLAATGQDATRLVTQNFNYQNLYLGHQISPSLSISEAFGLLTLNKTQLLDYENTTPQLFPVTTKQWQAYISPKISFNDRWSISPAFSLIGVDIESAVAKTNEITDSVLVVQPPRTPYWQINSKNVVTYETFSNSEMQYLISFMTEYRSSRADLWAELSKSNLNLQNQFQGRIGGRYYLSPKLYLESSLAFLTNSNSEFQPDTHSWIGSLASGYNLNRLNLYVFYTAGKMNNYSEQNGLILYNSLDPTDRMAGGSLKYNLIAGKLFLSVYYRQSRVMGATYVYTNGFYSHTTNYNYNTQSFTGGLTWLF